MSKTKPFGRAIASVLALVMVFACLCVPALAADAHPNDADMQVPKQVTQVGTKAFYKVEGSIVVYSDTDAEGFTAVPSAYITGSEYNEGNIAYGAYVVGTGKTAEVVFVPLSECYQNGGNYYFSHGTKDGATVSESVDTADNQDPTMGTDFYLRVENGIDPDGPSKEDVVPGVATGDERVSYDITVQTKSSYQLNATIPAYVCMYGYRGTGTVVTPTSDAYQLKNYSTMNMDSKATIVDIVKVTKFTQILDEDHSNETLAAIAYNATSKEYMWWYSMPKESEFVQYEGQGWTVNRDVTAENLNASGECYVIYIDGEWTFKAAGVLDDGALREQVGAIDPDHALAADFVFGEWNFGTEFSVGATQSGGEDEGMAIKVTELQAIPATWRLVPMSTGINSIGRGEIAMSIAPTKASVDASAIDLAACSAPVDITERGWYLAAPALDGVEVTTPTTLPLITNARMAGGNVNPSGCTSVVRVVYTVTPLFGIQDGQTNVVDSVDSNRA